jgi:hypothetical protein
MALSNVVISLQSKTLSDTLTAVSTEKIVPGTTVSRTILGQDFNFTVDSCRYKKGGTYDVTGSYDISSRLNTDLSASDVPSTASASELASTLIGLMDLAVSVSIDDWMPTGIKVKDSSTNKWVCNETYSSALAKIFGWTDILPTLLVNVYQRGNTIYCRQRGKETGTVILDESLVNYESLNYEWSKMLLLFDSDKTYYLTGDVVDARSDSSTDATDPTTYLSGQFTDNSGQQTLNYSYGLLKTEAFTSTDNTITSSTTYDYSKIYPPANLLTKTMTRTEQPSVTLPTDWTTVTLPYKVVTKIVNTSALTNTMADNGSDLLISREEINTVTTGYNVTDTNGTQVAFTDTETHVSETRYSDMGQGQWSVTTYKDSKLTGSQVVTGNPGAKASPYSIKTNSTMRSRRGSHVTAPRVELPGKFGGSMQINVSDKDTLTRIADAISNLNGKTQERVTLDYYGSELVDFRKTVTFDGNVYYLESNNISVTTDRGIKQSLNIVRWY